MTQQITESTNPPLIVQVERKHCNKCDRFFYPKIDYNTGTVIPPKYCGYRDCHNINWNKPKKHYFLKNKNTLVHRTKIIPRKLTILEKHRLEKLRNSPLNSLEMQV